MVHCAIAAILDWDTSGTTQSYCGLRPSTLRGDAGAESAIHAGEGQRRHERPGLHRLRSDATAYLRQLAEAQGRTLGHAMPDLQGECQQGQAQQASRKGRLSHRARGRQHIPERRPSRWREHPTLQRAPREAHGVFRWNEWVLRPPSQAVFRLRSRRGDANKDAGLSCSAGGQEHGHGWG